MECGEEAHEAPVLPLPRGISDVAPGPVYGLAKGGAAFPGEFAQWLAGAWTAVKAARLPLRGQHRYHTCFPFNLRA
jgi:hypothetical protein